VTHNGQVRLKTGTAVIVLVGVLSTGVLATGCGSPPPPALDPSPSAVPGGPTDAWGQLAARVATAEDKRYVASYRLTTKGRPDRTVTVTVANDGSWLVTVPGGALGGTADVAVADTRAGLYQCALSATPAPGCVLVAPPDGALPAKDDPRVQYLFTSWLSVLTDRTQAIAVNNSAALPGAAGRCFWIEPNSAALASPVDEGIYCYDADGTLTAARLAMGTFMLAGTPAAAPATVTLPAPVVAAAPLPTASPPPTPSTPPQQP
jgi:hypothetical protein